MLTCTVNGEARTLPEPLTVAQLLKQLGYDPRRVAVEVNCDVVPALRHAEYPLSSGDSVEVVTLVGGGAGSPAPDDKPLVIGKYRFRSRLITGTGKYASYELMRDCLAARQSRISS